jgi:antitoxin component of MazEF toxin-antitoxin module
MTLDYQKVWDALNNLEMVTSKICSAREILDSAIGELERGNNEKVETLMYATNEFLEYYLKEFDEKFKVAWKETVVKLKEEDPSTPPWGHSDLEYLAKHQANKIPAEQNGTEENDKVVRWRLPVEEVPDIATGETEYFITLPDDLLEAANLKEGDDVEWVDNDDGTFVLRKTKKTMSYDETIAAGYEMTADGFWIKS